VPALYEDASSIRADNCTYIHTVDERPDVKFFEPKKKKRIRNVTLMKLDNGENTTSEFRTKHVLLLQEL
jgi:hypothetical protein